MTENLEWHEVARTSDLSPGEVMYVEVGNDPVALINLEGEFFALHDMCTHEDAPLSDGEVIGDEIECPMHGGAFEIRTGLAGELSRSWFQSRRSRSKSRATPSLPPSEPAPDDRARCHAPRWRTGPGNTAGADPGSAAADLRLSLDRGSASAQRVRSERRRSRRVCERRRHRTNQRQPVAPRYATIAVRRHGWLELRPGPYQIVFNETVDLPNNLMALGRPRSSLCRIGATLGTAVWDAGYRGRSTALLIVENPAGMRIERAARVAPARVLHAGSADGSRIRRRIPGRESRR